MAIQWGNTSNYFRLGIDQVGTTLIVYGESVGYGHDWSATLTRSGSWSGSTAVSFYSGFDATVRKELYRQAVTSSGTYTASMSYWGGSSSVSRVVTLGSAPPAPTDLVGTRVNDTDLTLSWDASAGATSYMVQRQPDGQAWLNSGSVTGTSKSMPNMPVNDRHYLRVYASNAAGNSQYSNTVGPFYSKPAAPVNPRLGGTPNAVTVTYTPTAKYAFGVEVQAVGGTIQWFGTGTSPVATTVTLSGSWDVNQQFRVRTWNGSGGALGYAYSEWSAWSDTVQASVNLSPSWASLARRSVANVPNPLGANILILASGKTIAGSGNTMTLKARARVKGGTWGAYTTHFQGIAAGNFNVNFVLSGTFPVATAYEVEVVLSDAWGSYPHIWEIPTGQVPFSVGKTGVGAGKIWSQGALDVGGDAYVSGQAFIAGGVNGPLHNIISGTIVRTVAAGFHTFTLETGVNMATVKEVFASNGDFGAQTAMYPVGTHRPTSGTSFTAKFGGCTAGPARINWTVISN